MNCNELTNAIAKIKDDYKEFQQIYDKDRINKAHKKYLEIAGFVEEVRPERKTNWENAVLLDRTDLTREYGRNWNTPELSKFGKKVLVYETLESSHETEDNLVLKLDPTKGRKERIKIKGLEQDLLGRVVPLSDDKLAIELYGSRRMALVDLKTKEIIQESPNVLDDDERSIICAHGWLMCLRSTKIYGWKVGDGGMINAEPDLEEAVANYPTAEILPLPDGTFVFSRSETATTNSVDFANYLIKFNPKKKPNETQEIIYHWKESLYKNSSIAVLKNGNIAVACGAHLQILINRNGSYVMAADYLEGELITKIVAFPDDCLAFSGESGKVKVIENVSDSSRARTFVFQIDDQPIYDMCFADGVLYTSDQGNKICQWGEKRKK